MDAQSPSGEIAGDRQQERGLRRRDLLLSGGSLLAASAFVSAGLNPARAQQEPAPAAAGPRPNILVIFGDDIGMWNISAYNRGMMGYRTPNIDRIAKEGAIFTDRYAQQSCTAGRAAFITGQSCFRTGLLKVGLPGAKEGLSEKDPTIADLREAAWAMRPGSSARTTSATAMSICRQFTGSTSSTATSTTSMRRKSRRMRTTRRIRSSAPSSARAA